LKDQHILCWKHIKIGFISLNSIKNNYSFSFYIFRKVGCSSLYFSHLMTIALGGGVKRENDVVVVDVICVKPQSQEAILVPEY
jgi:hypothetical protein